MLDRRPSPVAIDLEQRPLIAGVQLDTRCHKTSEYERRIKVVHPKHNCWLSGSWIGIWWYTPPSRPAYRATDLGAVPRIRPSWHMQRTRGPAYSPAVSGEEEKGVHYSSTVLEVLRMGQETDVFLTHSRTCARSIHCEYDTEERHSYVQSHHSTSESFNEWKAHQTEGKRL